VEALRAGGQELHRPARELAAPGAQDEAEEAGAKWWSNRGSTPA